MEFGSFTDLALDMANNRAFIVHNNGTEILIVDLVSGDRVLFAKYSRAADKAAVQLS